MTKAQRLLARIRAHNRQRTLDAHWRPTVPWVVAEPAVIVRDSFNRPNKATLDNAETGQAYVDYGGALQIISNRCAWTSSGVDTANWLVDSGSSDIDLEYDCMSNADNVEFIFRGVDVSNWLLIAMVAAPTNAFECYKQVAGVYTRIANPVATQVAGQYYRIRVRAVGSSIIGYRDGVQMFSITETANQTGTLIGPRMRAANERIDNILCKTAS